MGIKRSCLFTFKQMAEVFIKACEGGAGGQPTKAAATILRYRTSLRQIPDRLCVMKADQISPSDVREFMEAASQRKKKRTVNLERLFVSAVYAWGIRQEYLKENPVRLVSAYKEEQKRIEILDLSEIALLESKATAFESVVLILGLGTMARARELEMLKLSDVNLDKAILRIKSPKTGEDHEIPIPRSVVNVFRRLSAEVIYPNNRIEPRQVHQRIYFFCGKDGRPFPEAKHKISQAMQRL